MADKPTSTSTSTSTASASSAASTPTPEPRKYQPGEGIRSMQSTTLFRAVNFELYAKPNIVIMAIGVVCFGTALGYITYMRSKYESQGYYAAMQEDGKEVFTKRRSKWD